MDKSSNLTVAKQQSSKHSRTKTTTYSNTLSPPLSPQLSSIASSSPTSSSPHSRSSSFVVPSAHSLVLAPQLHSETAAEQPLRSQENPLWRYDLSMLDELQEPEGTMWMKQQLLKQKQEFESRLPCDLSVRLSAIQGEINTVEPHSLFLNQIEKCLDKPMLPTFKPVLGTGLQDHSIIKAKLQQDDCSTLDNAGDYDPLLPFQPSSSLQSKRRFRMPKSCNRKAASTSAAAFPSTASNSAMPTSVSAHLNQSVITTMPSPPPKERLCAITSSAPISSVGRPPDPTLVHTNDDGHSYVKTLRFDDRYTAIVELPTPIPSHCYFVSANSLSPDIVVTDAAEKTVATPAAASNGYLSDQPIVATDVIIERPRPSSSSFQSRPASCAKKQRGYHSRDVVPGFSTFGYTEREMNVLVPPEKVQTPMTYVLPVNIVARQPHTTISYRRDSALNNAKLDVMNEKLKLHDTSLQISNKVLDSKFLHRQLNALASNQQVEVKKFDVAFEDEKRGKREKRNVAAAKINHFLRSLEADHHKGVSFGAPDKQVFRDTHATEIFGATKVTKFAIETYRGPGTYTNTPLQLQ